MKSKNACITKSSLLKDNKDLSFTAQGGDTEPIHASGYVYLLVMGD